MSAYKMRKIVVVMTSFNRKELTDNSINSILRYHYPNRHIIVVDDGSDIPYKYEHKDVTVIRNEKKQKGVIVQVVAYNLGISVAINEMNAEIVILQNAEAYHYGNILYETEVYLKDTNYISYACLSTTKEMLPINDEKIENHKEIDVAARGDVELGWYNHSIHYPRYYDFCSAITAENLKKLNGFDERFAKHAWYCDDNFIMRVNKLGLKPVIIDTPFVVHQWHSRSHQPFGYTPQAHELYKKTLGEEGYVAVREITEKYIKI